MTKIRIKLERDAFLGNAFFFLEENSSDPEDEVEQKTKTEIKASKPKKYPSYPLPVTPKESTSQQRLYVKSSDVHPLDNQICIRSESYSDLSAGTITNEIPFNCYKRTIFLSRF